jgi:hypothetical protein
MAGLKHRDHLALRYDKLLEGEDNSLPQELNSWIGLLLCLPAFFHPSRPPSLACPARSWCSGHHPASSVPTPHCPPPPPLGASAHA